MKRFLLDTGIVGHFTNRRQQVKDRIRDEKQRGAKIGICMPVLGELLFGVEASATRDQNLKRLREGLSGLVCWPFERAAAEEYGRLAAELKRIGRPMQQIDIQMLPSHAAWVIARSSAPIPI